MQNVLDARNLQAINKVNAMIFSTSRKLIKLSASNIMQWWSKGIAMTGYESLE